MKHHSHQESEGKIERYSPEFSFGLSTEQVNKRKEEGRVNIAKSPTNKSYTQIILGNVFTFINMLMVAMAIIMVIFVGPSVILNLLFLVILFFNTLIGTIQEIKSKRTVDKLKLLNASKIKVRRNGEIEEINPIDIVLDDVIILNPGDQIPVDGYLLEEDKVQINESLLTGESFPVKKSLGDKVYGGSFVVSGTNSFRADKIANDTYIQSIESKARLAKQPKSKLMVAIKKIIRTMAYIAIPLAVVVFFNEFLHGIRDPQGLPMTSSFWGEKSLMSNAILYSSTTITYMIPAGMALLASIAMATGVVKLGENNVLAQNLYSVELLSRVNTLCLDKTGTLTDGTMTCESFELYDDKVKEEELEKLISSYLSAFKADNGTSQALISRFGNKRHFEIEQTIQFNSSRKFSAVKFKGLGWYSLGAPDYLTGDESVLKHVNELASNGLRIVLLAKIDEEFTNEDILPGKRHNIALFINRDTIRPEVYDTMKWFKENDVDIKVISGDNIHTVSYIAKQSGIDNWDKTVDFSKLTKDDNLEEIVMNNAIFGRVNPDQKAEIISILKKNGRITGVTGDGINDLLAFKQADCSIALASGTPATKNVANLILLDSNFANMKEAVFQGRRVVNNIQRSSTLFVMKDFLWLFITLLPIFLGITHVIEPTVMTIVNVFITGIASLFLALEPDRTRFKGDFYKNVIKTALTSGFYMFVPVMLVIATYLISQISVNGNFVIGYEGPLINGVANMKTSFLGSEVTNLGWVSVVAICVTISGFIIFFNNCRPFTKFRMVLFVSTLAFVLLILYMIPDFFIISGTDLLNAIDIKANGIKSIFFYAYNHLGENARFGLYGKMTLTQGLFVLLYCLSAYPLFLLNQKFSGKVVDRLLFSKRDFSDE